MAITTYTFPNQVVNSGTLGFTIITHDGPGGTVAVSEKYFSVPIRVTDETEYFGGDLQSAYADITIEDDVDNLFHSTILPKAKTVEGYAKVKITLDSDIMFYGVIAPSTISEESYFATNDILTGERRKISFRCIWLLNLLKNISREELAHEFDVNDYTQVTRLRYAGDYLRYGSISLRQLIVKALDMLSADFGVTYNLVVNDTGLNFYTKPANDSSINYAFDVNHSATFPFDWAMDYINPLDLHICFYDYYNTVLAGPMDDEIGLPTAYDYFVQFLKSLGLVATIKHSSTFDVIITIGSRVSGELVVPENIIGSTSSIMSELARNNISINSSASGNDYNEKIPGVGGSSYSDSLFFDFHNDNDFPGTANHVRSQYSLMVPYEGNVANRYYMLARECGAGPNKLTNPNFGTNIDGWSVSEGSVSYDSANVFGYNGSAAFSTVLSLSRPSSTLYQEVAIDPAKDYIFSVRAKIGSVISPGVAGGISLRLAVYFGDKATGVGQTVNLVSGVGAYHFVYNGNRQDLTRLTNKTARVEVGVTNNFSVNTGATVHVGLTGLFYSRRGCPQLVGEMLKEYFGNPSTNRRQVNVNGIANDISLRDYFVYEGENYFIKKMDFLLDSNETEIEAINYQ